MRKVMKALFKGRKGFTLVELMTVVAILAVLAAIVFPAVTGTTTATRDTTQSLDINAVQTGLDRFNSDSDTSGNATSASLTGASPGWSAGELPDGSATGSGTSSSPYVFTENDIAGVNFSATTSVNGVTKTFQPDFLRSLPDHNSVTIAVGASSSSSAFNILKGGEDVYVKLSNGTGSSLSFPAWGVDKNGETWVFVDKDSY